MSIRLKLAIAFLVIALVPAILVGTITFMKYEKFWEAERTDDLEAIAVYKAEKIEEYFARLRADIRILQNTDIVKRNFSTLLRFADNPAAAEFIAAKKLFDKVLPQTAAILGLSDIWLFNQEGKIIYASDPQYYAKVFLKSFPDSQQKAFSEGKKQIYFSEIFREELKGNKPTMLITAPVFDLNEAFVGVMALEVDLAPIYKLIQEVTGLGKTGETLLGKKVGPQVLFLNPLRHEPQAALAKRITIGESLGLAIQAAAQGKNGSGQVIDYRGKKVIGAWRYIPSLGWGLVAKMDTAEAFADIIILKRWAVIILVVIFILASIVALAIAKTISDPLQRLSEGAETIGSGNLDYKVGTNRKDEVGQLSRAFDKMTRDLKKVTASRDELNREIAERKFIQEALEISETRFRRLFETAKDGILIMDADTGRITGANPSLLGMLGSAREHLLGKELWELGLLKDRAAAQQALMELREKGHLRYENLPLATKDGRIIHVEFVSNIYAVDNKKVIQCNIRDITVRKQIEKALKLQEEQLEERFNELVQIYKYSPVGLFVVDRSFCFLRVNEHLAEINGKSMEQHLGHPLSDVIPRSMAEELVKIWQPVFEKGESVLNVELKGETSKIPGQERYWLANYFPFKSSTGEVLGLAGAVMEITDRKIAEENLRQTRNYLEKLLNYANAPIICWDRNFRITRFNHAFEHLTNYREQEVLGQDLSRLFPEQSKKESLEKIRAASSGEQWDSVEIPILRKDWEIRTVLWNSANIYAEDGKTHIATIAQGQDITARKMAEEALRKSRDELEFRVQQRTAELRQANELMEKIFSTTHISIVYLDPQFNFIRVNKAYAQGCGYPPEFFIGKNHFDLYPDAENQAIFENVVKTGQPFSIFAKPFVFPDHPDWGVTYWDWSLLPVKDSAGAVEGLVFCLVDITKRKLAEEELEKTQKQLIEVKRLSDIGTLAATVAHELRNPLAAIHMAAYNMHRKAKNSALDRHLEVIERKINESDQIINNLLFYSRIKPPKYEPINIYTIVEECLALAKDRFMKENVTMVKQLKELKSVMMEGDSLQLKEVFSNIINNAFDAMHNRGGKIVVSGGIQGPWICVQVVDEGPGIDENDLQKVFDPFFTTKAQGTGLGLTVCKQIVTLHGGTIDIRSEIGKGTTVSVQLPAGRENHG